MELWRTDGTPDGTGLVKDINPGPAGSYPMQLVALGSRLLFTARHATAGTELWQSDGTPEGTSIVVDLTPDPERGAISFLTVAGQYAYFTLADCPTSGAGCLWRTDGSAAGTRQLAAVSAREFTPLGTQVYFLGGDASGGDELWLTGGTPETTRRVRDIAPGGEGSTPADLTVLNDRLFFTADDGAHGRELWVSDGSEQGTQLVKDILHGAGGALEPFSLTFCSQFAPKPVPYDGRLYFAANDGAAGYELWATDGTETGTTLVRNLNPTPFQPGAGGLGSSYPHGLTPLAGRLVFAASDDEHGFELWQTDGTPAGTARLTDINPGQASSVLFTYSVGSVLCPLLAVFGAQKAVGEALFFTADDGVHGRELWALDGATAAERLSDIAPEAAHATPDELASAGGRLIFRAQHGDQVSVWALDIRRPRSHLPLIQ